MPDQWLTIAEAAAMMKIHPRTVERRAAAGKLNARRNDDGQVQILIDVPDPTPDPVAEPVSSEAFETVREMADRQVDIAAGSASALVRAAQEQAMRAENQTLLARQEAGRYRRETQMALALVAVVLLLVVVAVGWCTTTITSARDKAASEAEQARRAVDDARQATTEVHLVREQLVTATTAQAKAEGELTAYKAEVGKFVQQTNARPATRPSNLVGWLTQGFSNE
jgi:hypothetical protein